MNPDHGRALRCARHYRSLGLSPLPSREDVKGPALPSYAEYRAVVVPESVYSADAWHTSNIQLMTGATAGRTKVVVVDLDGPESERTWRSMQDRFGDAPGGTWEVRTGSGGRHVYFRLPWGYGECPSRRLWGRWDTWGRDGKGDWCHHEEIRLLADNALAIAPPSIHVDTGVRYEFLAGRSPREHRLPAEVPGWILALPPVVAPRTAPPPAPAPMPARTPLRPQGERFDRERVLDAIGDKAALARSWGLRIAGHDENPHGWVACHAIGRDDVRPSATFSPATGRYWDHRDDSRLGLFDLGVELGRFGSWLECLDWCGDQYVSPS